MHEAFSETKNLDQSLDNLEVFSPLFARSTRALKIVELAVEQKITSGRGPAGIAVAATYIASVLMDERRIQTEFAQTGKKTEVTIRNRYKELNFRFNFEIRL